MPGSRLIDPHNCALLVIDVQSKLVPAIHRGDELVDSCGWVMDVADDLNIPMLMTEQYAEGLGTTVSQLRDRMDANAIFDKTWFSCVYEEGFIAQLESMKRDQLVVVGMEAHVCVMQTVLALLDIERDVFVVTDSIGSRYPTDRETAIDRMRQAGAVMISREMLYFEWQQRAGNAEFSQRLKRHVTGPKGLDKRRHGY